MKAQPTPRSSLFSPPQGLVLPDNVGFHLRMVQLRVFHEFQRVFRGTGITPELHTVLTIIRDNPGLRQRTLAEILMVRPPNMTQIVTRLNEGGLVSRKVDMADRRAVRIRLTRLGEQVLQDARIGLDALEARLLANLTGAERTTLRGLLDAILARLD